MNLLGFSGKYMRQHLALSLSAWRIKQSSWEVLVLSSIVILEWQRLTSSLELSIWFPLTVPVRLAFQFHVEFYFLPVSFRVRDSAHVEPWEKGEHLLLDFPKPFPGIFGGKKAAPFCGRVGSIAFPRVAMMPFKIRNNTRKRKSSISRILAITGKQIEL